MSKKLKNVPYTITEAAEEFGYSIHDLIHYAVMGKLKLAAYFSMSGKVTPYPHDTTEDARFYNGLYYINGNDLRLFAFNRDLEKIGVYYVFPIETDKYCNSSNMPPSDYINDKPLEYMQFENSCTVYYKDLFIVSADLRQFLQEEESSCHEEFNKTPLRKENRKTINFLLKMIIAMACDRYSYDPRAKKSEVPKHIAEDAEELGLTIDTDAIRKWLREGIELVDPPNLDKYLDRL